MASTLAQRTLGLSHCAPRTDQVKSAEVTRRQARPQALSVHPGLSPWPWRWMRSVLFGIECPRWILSQAHACPGQPLFLAPSDRHREPSPARLAPSPRPRWAPVSARQELTPRAISPSPASLPPHFHSPARGPSLRTLTADPSTFNTGPAPRGHPAPDRAQPPSGPHPLPARRGPPGGPAWPREAGSRDALPAPPASAFGSSRWLSTADSSRHRAPPYAPLSSSQPLTSCNGRARSLLLPCPPQPWACGPFHPKTQCGPGGLLDVPGLGGQRWCSRRGHQVAAQGPGRLPKGACGWDCREPRSSRR